MRVLTEGHKYIAANFENPEDGQTIQFIEKVPANPGSTDLETVSDGTTNEELLAVLVNRINYLNGKFPCRENSLAITKLQEALFWLNERTNNRVKKGVEGKQIAH